MPDSSSTTRFRFWLLFVRLIGVLVPRRLRADWRQEWEAELHYRETLLAEWDKLDWKNKLALLWHSAGAFADALWLQPRRWEDEMFQDLRFGVRMLLKHKGFTFIAVLTLALGIGANTAIFSVVNALVFNPLPYPQSQRLMWITNVFRGNELIGSDMYLTFQAQSQTFEHMAAFNAATLTLTREGATEEVNRIAATASLFPTLGITPWLGRAFTPEEDRPGALPVVVLSHDYWQRRFGGNSSIVGQEVPLGKEKRTVLGVMPPGFRFLPERRVGGKVDILIPLVLHGEELSSLENDVIGRLKPGVSVAQARAELDLLLQPLLQAHPEMTGLKASVTPLAEKLVGHLRRGLLVLFGAVGLVLLIACVNVANLLLARASARQKELAIRAAVGAGRKRLIRQMLTESLMLSVLGGLAGLWLARWGVKALVASAPENMLLLKLSSIDNTVLGFTFFATLLTGVVAGLIPALQASRIDLNESLKDGARSASFFRRKSTAPVLVIGELALTLVVLIGAGLLVKSFARMRAVDPGYNPKNLLTMVAVVNHAKYPFGSPQRKQFNQALLTRLSALPGVQAVANSRTLPLSDDGIIGKGHLTVVGAPPLRDEQKPMAEGHSVSPDYFRTLGMKLRAGRGFTEQDTENTPTVIVINETLARRLFAGEDPIGKRLRIEGDKMDVTIVGVVADVKRYGLEAESQAEFYRSFFQDKGASGGRWILRTTSDPLALVAAVRQQVRELEADSRLAQVMTMEQLLADSYAPRRFQTWLFGIFAAVALALAAVGVYGVISYSVSRRTHEIGIRMALGAQAWDVLLLVVRQGMTLALIGVAVGVAAAYGLTRLMTSLLFNVRATDPATFAVISLLLMGIAFLAAYLPARRATKVDPLVALRHE
jgi:putative ABC transport system permease protein